MAVSFPRDRIQWVSIIIVSCFVAVLSLRSQSGASYPTYILAIIVLSTFAQWKDIFESSLIRWVGLLLVWLGVTALWSTPFSLGDAASTWVRCVLVFCFVVGFAEAQMRDQLQMWLGKALLIVGSLAMLAAMLNFWMTDPIDNRLNGLGQLDTHVVAALVFGVVLVFGLHLFLAGRGERPIVRGFYLAAVMVCAVGVFLSDSRNAIACVLFAAVTIISAHLVTNKRMFVLILLCVAIVGGVFLFFAFYTPELSALVFPRGDSFRFQLWQETLAVIEQGGMWFGLGIDTPDEIAMNGFIAMHPHNLYLAVLFQGGVVALGLYGAVLIKSIRILIKYYDATDAKLALAILALALPSHLLDGHELVDKVSDTWFLIWLPVAIAVGLSWRYDNIVPLNDG